LKITTEPLENRQLRLSIELDEEQTQQAMRRAARQIARQVNIPGFRKGKAPYNLIVQRYGEDTVRQEAAEMLAEEVYRQALEQQEIIPYDAGVLQDVSLNPIAFEFAVPLQPTVDLGDYRSYRLKPRKVRVYKKEVQEALEEIREQNALLELVDRPAAMDDGVAMNLAARSAEGEEFLQADDAHMLLEAESTDPAPGFSEAVVGMEAGEERTFTLTLPDDFPREELRGEEAEFTVEMVEVYKSTLPELDDDLARTVGNFETLKELEDQIKAQLRQKAQSEADSEYTNQVMEAILEQAQVEYPPVMLEEELDELVEDVEQVVQRKARLSLEDYLRIQNQSLEDLREELEPQAAARLKRALILGEIVRQEELDVDQEEVGAQIEGISASWGIRADDVRSSLSSDAGRKAVGNRLLAAKAVRRLVAIAKGEAPEPGSTETEPLVEEPEEGTKEEEEIEEVEGEETEGQESEDAGSQE